MKSTAAPFKITTLGFAGLAFYLASRIRESLLIQLFFTYAVSNAAHMCANGACFKQIWMRPASLLFASDADVHAESKHHKVTRRRHASVANSLCYVMYSLRCPSARPPPESRSRVMMSVCTLHSRTASSRLSLGQTGAALAASAATTTRTRARVHRSHAPYTWPHTS